MKLDTAIQILKQDHKETPKHTDNPLYQAQSIALIVLIAFNQTVKELSK